jgi:hypothetical protein
VPGSDYPKLATVQCAICDRDVLLVIEQLAGHGPQLIAGNIRWPFEFYPTVLTGCEHWDPQE